MNWRSWGFDSFMTKTIPSSEKISSIEARNLIPIGGISPSRLVSPLNASTDIVFSSTDNDTAAWTSGTLYFADKTDSGTIDAGNTGNITVTTYVYYDKEVLGALQTTTTVSDASGASRLLIAIVEKGATGKDCKITPTIAAGLIVSGITADQIAAGTITANEITVSQLDAFAVNTGTLTVDESISVGSARIKFDGANNRILVSDATYGRLLFDNDGSFKISNDGKEVTTVTGTDLAFYFNPSTNSIKKGGFELVNGKEFFLTITHAGSSGGNNVMFGNDSESYQNLSDGEFLFNPDDYPGATFYLEIVGRAGASGDPLRTTTCNLYNVTDAGAVASSTASTTQTSAADGDAPGANVRFRSSAITFVSGDKEYILQFKTDTAGRYADVASAKLIISYE